MLDKSEEIFHAKVNDQSFKFVDGAELNKLETASSVVSDTVATSEEFVNLTGQELADFGLISLTPTSRTELARELDLVAGSLDGNPAQGGNWKAIQLDLPEIINTRTSKWIVSSLRQQLGKSGTNLVILNFESNTGDVDACLRVARHLAEYDSDEIRTVAFVRDRTQGSVGLIAMACDQLIMAPDAVLGGHQEFEAEVGSEFKTEFDEEELETLLPMVKSLAEECDSDWSMMMQMIQPGLVVTRFKHKESEQLRLLSNEEFEALPDLEMWQPVGPIGGLAGIDSKTAEKNFLARFIAEDIGQVQNFYELDDIPRSIRRSETDRWAERLAAYLSSPMISMVLIFAATVFLSTELSAPGLGVPGFLSAVCFILFFWSQSLGGNADLLEIIMFVVGVIFIGLELLVLPGFGIFGIGGILLVLTSLVLASQSFLIPRSSAELVQMSYSLLPVIGAGFGLISGAVLLRNLIPRSPFLRRMILEPRTKRLGIDGEIDPEAVVDWSYLQGESGETITRLGPSGKAKIAGKIYNVISKGQMVDKGEPVEVVEAVGNRIVVRAINQPE